MTNAILRGKPDAGNPHVRFDKVFCSLLMVAVATAAFGSVTVDFSEEKGKVRHELHSSGFGPIIYCPRQSIDDIKSMNMFGARTHDWALLNNAKRVCDYFHIFPLMHLDATDPKNYHFGPTDYLLGRTRDELGLDILFRLGPSIDGRSQDGHFNSLIPDDFGKVAETFAATIRHYNRGWADGFNWNIRYWEIWNEPDNKNMWGSPVDDLPQNDALRRQKFIRFFATSLKRIKAEFPEVKVGGPALVWYYEQYFKELLAACKAADVAPDFISWHYYNTDPSQLMRQADAARALCDSYGFKKCELFVDEWHYFGDVTWDDVGSQNPDVLKRVHEGPRSINGVRSAVFVLATLARFQTSKIDRAYYYGCRHTGPWGYRNEFWQKNKVYYALKLFGTIVRDYPVLCGVTGGEKSLATLAVKTADGSKKALLVADYKTGLGRRLSLDVRGAEGGKVSAVVLDNDRNLEPCQVQWENGSLVIEKKDDEDAAFLVEFSK